MKPTENIELHVVSQLSHESASSSKGNIEEIATRTEDGIERDGAIADQMSPLNRLGSDSVTDHEDEVFINKGNILFVKLFCVICIIMLYKKSEFGFFLT